MYYKSIERQKIVQDLAILLESGQFSDVPFVIGNKQKKEFSLHMNILATRSPVFSAMFTNECVEKQTNRVEITDMTVPVFEKMIRYIYMGKTGPELELYAEELFVAADKYQMDLLKFKASRELATKNRITTESVSRMLVLADMHNSELLKRHCIKYINKHVKEVIQTEAWKVMIEPRIDLMVLLYRDMANWK